MIKRYFIQLLDSLHVHQHVRVPLGLAQLNDNVCTAGQYPCPLALCRENRDGLLDGTWCHVIDRFHSGVFLKRTTTLRSTGERWPLGRRWESSSVLICKTTPIPTGRLTYGQ